MCGIVGAVNAALYDNRIEDFVKDGILVGTVRGNDSTGILQVDQRDGIYVHKKPINGPNFLNDRLTATYITDSNRSVITLVHHRAATSGAINKNNAHPFIVDKLTVNSKTRKHHIVAGVHNGSLTNWKTQLGAKDYEVDSEWALSRIAIDGDAAFKKIQGPYCFVWVDSSKPGILNIARNNGRPMHVVFSKDRKQMFFASEAGMLSWLCERNRITTEDEILVITSDRIYSFDTNGDKIKFSSVPTPRPAYTPVATTTTAATTRPTTGTIPASTTVVGGAVPFVSLNDAGRKFIQGIKDAAQGKQAPQTSLPLEELTIDEAAIDSAVTAIIGPAEEEVVGQRDDDSPESISVDKCPTTWFSDTSATAAEKETAKKWGMFRELQWFQGVTYDDQSCEILGDIEVWERDIGKVKYSGVVRGCSFARAQAQFLDNKPKRNSAMNGNWVVVIGAREEKQLGKVLVVAEVNQKGLEVIEAKRAVAN